ncbi:hypothetical protein ABQF35_11150 [Mycobacterium syngnathidarum]
MSANQLHDDGLAQRRVIETFERLAEWQLRLSQPYRPPTPSELATEDEDWAWFPASTIAWAGLAAASDHLNAIRKHVEARILFGSAHLTLCRSALVGAAQCVWVLGPDDRETRLARSRTVTAEIYKRHLQYLRGLQERATTPHIGTDTVAGHIAQRLDDLKAKRDADGQRAELDTTNMIRQASEIAFGRADLVEEAVLAWRSTSGAAHGLPWPLFGTAGTVMTKLAGDDGLAEFQTGGSLARIANAYLAAYYLGEHGWKLLEHRGARETGA